MRMIGAEYGTDLRGPTVCEVIEEPEIADVVAKLGPDPLRRDADGGLAWARIRKSRRPIGALLMDQAVISGIGNVYRNELLYRHRIDPYRPGTHIDEAEFHAMWTDLVELMKVGLRRGKIIVEFSGREDLERIVSEIIGSGPGMAPETEEPEDGGAPV